jgi:hypothetical protein
MTPVLGNDDNNPAILQAFAGVIGGPCFMNARTRPLSLEMN